MRWPWQRRDSEPTPRPGASAEAPRAQDDRPSPMGWAFLPPLQRQVGEMPMVSRPASFPSQLPAWRNPSFIGTLAHRVSAEAPSGVIDGDGGGTGQPSVRAGAHDLTLLAPEPVRLHSTVQRAAGTSSDSSGGSFPSASSLTTSPALGLPLLAVESYDVPPLEASQPDQSELDQPELDQPEPGALAPDGQARAGTDGEKAPNGSEGAASGTRYPSLHTLQRSVATEPSGKATTTTRPGRTSDHGPAVQRDAGPGPSGSTAPTGSVVARPTVGGRRLGLGPPLTARPETSHASPTVQRSPSMPLAGPDAAAGFTEVEVPIRDEGGQAGPTPSHPAETGAGAPTLADSPAMSELSAGDRHDHEAHDPAHHQTSMLEPPTASGDVPPVGGGSPLDTAAAAPRTPLPLATPVQRTVVDDTEASGARDHVEETPAAAPSTGAAVDGGAPALPAPAPAPASVPAPVPPPVAEVVQRTTGFATAPTLGATERVWHPEVVQRQSVNPGSGPGMPRTAPAEPARSFLQTAVALGRPEGPTPGVGATGRDGATTPVSTGASTPTTSTADASVPGTPAPAVEVEARSGSTTLQLLRAAPDVTLATGSDSPAAHGVSSSASPVDLPPVTQPAVAQPPIARPSVVRPTLADHGPLTTLRAGDHATVQRRAVSTAGPVDPVAVSRSAAESATDLAPVLPTGWRSAHMPDASRPAGMSTTARSAHMPTAVPAIQRVSAHIPTAPYPPPSSAHLPLAGPVAQTASIADGAPVAESTPGEAAARVDVQTTAVGAATATEPAQEADATPLAGPAGAAGGGAPAGGTEAQNPEQVEALAQRLFTPLMRRIKSEMLLDRERRGLRTDAW